MAPYRYTAPVGWRPQARRSIEDPIYLREPPGTEKATILLLHPIASTRPVVEELPVAVEAWCKDAEILERSEVSRFPGSTLPTDMVAVRLRIERDGQVHDERRIFILVDAGREYLPIVFLGGPGALPAHEHALAALVASVAPSQSPFIID